MQSAQSRPEKQTLAQVRGLLDEALLLLPKVKGPRGPLAAVTSSFCSALAQLSGAQARGGGAGLREACREALGLARLGLSELERSFSGDRAAASAAGSIAQ